MDELTLLKSLNAQQYRMYRFFVLNANEHAVAWDMTVERIMQELDISYQTVYKTIRELVKKELIVYEGYKKSVKINAL